MAPARDSQFLPEIWGLFGVGTVILLLRFAVRARTLGIFGYQLEDAFALSVLANWTYSAAIIHVTYYTGTNTDWTEAGIKSFPPEKLAVVPNASVLVIARWGIREIAVAILAVNAAALRPCRSPSTRLCPFQQR